MGCGNQECRALRRALGVLDEVRFAGVQGSQCARTAEVRHTRSTDSIPIPYLAVDNMWMLLFVFCF